MKLGRVIGRVTFNVQVPSFRGGRWLIVSPMTNRMLKQKNLPASEMSNAPSLIVYDSLGGRVGDIIGYVEGREASMPFDDPTPVDAYCSAIVDQVEY